MLTRGTGLSADCLVQEWSLYNADGEVTASRYGGSEIALHRKYSLLFSVAVCGVVAVASYIAGIVCGPILALQRDHYCSWGATVTIKQHEKR